MERIMKKRFYIFIILIILLSVSNSSAQEYQIYDNYLPFEDGEIEYKMNYYWRESKAQNSMGIEILSNISLVIKYEIKTIEKDAANIKMTLKFKLENSYQVINEDKIYSDFIGLRYYDQNKNLITTSNNTFVISSNSNVNIHSGRVFYHENPFNSYSISIVAYYNQNKGYSALEIGYFDLFNLGERLWFYDSNVFFLELGDNYYEYTLTDITKSTKFFRDEKVPETSSKYTDWMRLEKDSGLILNTFYQNYNNQLDLEIRLALNSGLELLNYSYFEWLRNYDIEKTVTIVSTVSSLPWHIEIVFLYPIITKIRKISDKFKTQLQTI